MNNVEINIKFLDNNIDRSIPLYATEGSAGMDIKASISSPVTLKPLERALIPAGISIKLPNSNYGAFLFARSGLSAKHGITLANCVGVIDSDYTGEIKVALVNLSNESYTIENGERIAQLVIMEVSKAKFNVVDSLESTSRGSGGFGSTGSF